MPFSVWIWLLLNTTGLQDKKPHCSGDILKTFVPKCKNQKYVTMDNPLMAALRSKGKLDLNQNEKS